MGVAVATTLLLAGCSSGDHQSNTGHGNTPTSTNAGGQGAHNDADVAFARHMVPHHQQAVDMAELATSRAANPKVKDLATRIKQAQDPEIQLLNGWLKQWGAPSAVSTPPSVMEHGSTDTSAPGADHGAEAGMMTEAEMRELEQASGGAFDRLFLQMMIWHHEGAIEQSKIEVEKGANVEAKALAQRIIETQQKEITEMQELQKAL